MRCRAVPGAVRVVAGVAVVGLLRSRRQAADRRRGGLPADRAGDPCRRPLDAGYDLAAAAAAAGTRAAFFAILRFLGSEFFASSSLGLRLEPVLGPGFSCVLGTHSCVLFCLMHRWHGVLPSHLTLLALHRVHATLIRFVPSAISCT